MLLGSLTRSLVTAACVFLVSLIFVRFPIAHPFLVLYFMVFVSLTFSSAGMMMALFAEEFEHLTMATTFVITPLVFFGGVFHSLQMVPGPLRLITQFNPIFYMVSGIRYSMLGISDAPLAFCMMVVAALTISLTAANIYLFKTGFKLRK